MKRACTCEFWSVGQWCTKEILAVNLARWVNAVISNVLITVWNMVFHELSIRRHFQPSMLWQLGLKGGACVTWQGRRKLEPLRCFNLDMTIVYSLEHDASRKWLRLVVKDKVNRNIIRRWAVLLRIYLWIANELDDGLWLEVSTKQSTQIRMLCYR